MFEYNINEVGPDAHLIIGASAIKETHLDHRRVGFAKDEVGLIQVHGPAQQGHKKEEIRNNYKLGIELGVRWFNKSIEFCKTHNMKRDHEWLQPMSAYIAGGKKAQKEGGGCKVFAGAKRRLRIMRKYRYKIRRNLT